MNSLELRWVWAVDDLFHFGSGLSRAGYADRAIRKEVDSTGREVPVLAGDAVKGILRMSAEQIIHWLGAGLPEQEDLSYPTNGVLERLFAGDESAVWYRPGAGAFAGNGHVGAPRLVASTAVDSTTGVACDHTLRVTEAWEGGARFTVALTAEGGRWEAGSPDLLDAHILLAAIVNATSAGAKTSSGFGGLRCESLKWNGQPVDPSSLWTLENLQDLREHAGNAKGLTRRRS